MPDSTSRSNENGVEHLHGVARGDVDVLRQVGADGDEHRVEAAGFLLGEHVLDPVVEDDADAGVLNPADLVHQVFARQAVGGNAEMQHAAGQRTGLVDLDLMAEARQVVSCGEAARAGADDEHALAGRRRADGQRQASRAARSPR